MSDLKELATKAAAEIRDAVAVIDPAAMDGMVEELTAAKRVVCYGVGREGLMMRALSMRLYHLGLDAHVVGDMSCPPVGKGDLLLVSAGPGTFSTVEALIGVARSAGARVACVTAQPGGLAPGISDRVFHIPAQTMANDQGAAATSVLPMGSLYEGAQYLAFELLILALRDRMEFLAEGDARAAHQPGINRPGIVDELPPLTGTGGSSLETDKGASLCIGALPAEIVAVRR